MKMVNMKRYTHMGKSRRDDQLNKSLKLFGSKDLPNDSLCLLSCVTCVVTSFIGAVLCNEQVTNMNKMYIHEKNFSQNEQQNMGLLNVWFLSSFITSIIHCCFHFIGNQNILKKYRSAPVIGE